jgi:hypothetical protein
MIRLKNPISANDVNEVFFMVFISYLPIVYRSTLVSKKLSFMFLGLKLGLAGRFSLRKALQ